MPYRNDYDRDLRSRGNRAEFIGRDARASRPSRPSQRTSRSHWAARDRASVSSRNHSHTRRPIEERGRGRGMSRLKRTILMDLALTIAGLLVFLLFQRVLHSSSAAPTQLPTNTAAATSNPSATNTGGATPTDGTANNGSGPFASKFPNKFTTGDVQQTDTTYKSKNIDITITQSKYGNSVYYVADIYVSDIKYLKTAFARSKYGGGSDSIFDTMSSSKGILGINGDYYSARNDGIVIRNGDLYRDKVYADVLIMNNDGSMATYTADEFDINAVKENGAWQGWSFGPMLLNNGQPMTTFNSNVVRANPRTAIGYYEPGHYCMVVVDGRQNGYSSGIKMADLSQLMYDLGCKVAYNLDGGQSSMMVFNGKFVNKPYKDGRSVSDIVYIGEEE